MCILFILFLTVVIIMPGHQESPEHLLPKHGVGGEEVPQQSEPCGSHLTLARSDLAPSM